MSLAVRCAVCHVVAGTPCRTLGEYPGQPLPYPHRGRAGTNPPAAGTCTAGWREHEGRMRSGSHDCNLPDGHGADHTYVVGEWALDNPTDHVCRCGDRFSHAAAVGMSS